MRTRIWSGTLLIATGLVISGAAAFNWYWARTSVGRPDLAARGGILLLVSFPMIFAAAAILTWLIFALMTRRVPLAGWERVGMPLSAAGSGIAVALLTVFARSFLPSPLRMAEWLTPAFAFGCVAGGGALAWRATHPRPPEIASSAT
jgi:hypothetical protein